MTDRATRSPIAGAKHHSALRLVAAAEFLSSVGTGVSMLALPTIAVLSLSVGPLGAATLLAAELAPAALMGPLAGSVMDRLTSVRWAMIGSDLGRGLALLAIPILDSMNALHVWHIYCVAAVIGGLTPFSSVGTQSIVPRLVTSRNRLPAANSMMSAAASLGFLLGPALGGLLIGAVGPVRAVYIDAASYAISASLLCLVRETREQDEDASDFEQGIRPALRFVLRHVLLRRVILGTALLNVCGAAIGGIFVLFAYRRLDLSPEAVGVTFSCAAAAGVCGAAVASKLICQIGLKRVVIGSSLIAATSLFLIPSAVTMQPLVWLVAYQLIFNSSATVLAISLVTVRQVVAPPSMRGRVNAFSQSVSTATIPLGALAGGSAAQWIGLFPTLIIFATLASTSWVTYARVAEWNQVTVAPSG